MAAINTIKNVSLGVFHGFWDSIRGMTLVLYIDEEIHKLNEEKEVARQRRLLDRQRRVYRTPSPTPSSASAMEREEKQNSPARLLRDNPDERHLDSILKRQHASEEQKPQGEKKVAKQVLKCCLLNGGFTWLSIIFFEQLLLPTLKFVLTLCYGKNANDLDLVWGWLQSVLSIIFGMMWVLPIFLLSKVVSSLWFADIANAAYQVRKGRPQLIPNISKLVADFLFSLVVQALFLVQSMLVNLLPIRYVGEFLCFVHLCMLYSLYSFEYKWFNMGWELHRRLSYIENNWPYFLGFGIPLTVLTNMSASVIVSSCIFSIFFPLFILSGNEAKPLVGTTDTPLRLFSPVIFFSNLFFSRPDAYTAGIAAHKLAQQHQHLQQQHQQQQYQQLLVKQQMQDHYKHQHRSQQRTNIRRQESPAQINRQQEFVKSHVAPIRSTRNVTPPVTSSGRTTPDYVRPTSGMRPPLIPTPVPGSPSASAVATAAAGAAHRN